MLTTNITHFVTPNGNTAKDMPKEAKELASFLTLIIEASTDVGSDKVFETEIRCNQTNCHGTIHSDLLIEDDYEIYWWCPE